MVHTSWTLVAVCISGLEQLLVINSVRMSLRHQTSMLSGMLRSVASVISQTFVNPLQHIHEYLATPCEPFSFLLREHCAPLCDFRVNKRTQRVYKYLWKRLNPLLYLLLLHNFLSFPLGKIEFFVVLLHLAVNCSLLTPSPPSSSSLLSFTSHFSPSFSFPSVSYALLL